MYYEEEVIDGTLMGRSTPEGGPDRWTPATTPHAGAVNALAALTPAQRKTAFGFFCVHCGDADPKCACWNDD